MERPLEVVELDHVVLRCRDQRGTLDFYTRVLGLQEERRLERLGLVQLRAGGAMVDLVPASEPRQEAGLNLEHFCLGIAASDMEAVARYLRGQLVEIIGEVEMRYGARGTGPSLYLRDPEGNVVELKQLPPEERR
jgi:glyoxylase I family protein